MAKNAPFSACACGSTSKLLNDGTPFTLVPSESPLYVNFTFAGVFGSGAVLNVPTSLKKSSFRNRYQYCLFGCNPVASILTVSSRAAVVLNLPWNTLGGCSAALSKTSTLMFVATSALVQRIARDDVTSPLATPSGKLTGPVTSSAIAAA